MRDYSCYKVPAKFISDGCTVPFFLKPIYRRYASDCRWHDWARRHLVHYGVLTVQEADAELYRRWVSRGMWRWVARPSWLVVKLTRKHFSATHPVRPDWLEYIYPTEDNT